MSISVSPRGSLGLPEPIQLPRLEERSVEMHEGGVPHLRGGLSNEGSHLGFAVGKVHRSRMHILPKMCRSLHNKSHQTKIPIGLDLWRLFLQKRTRARTSIKAIFSKGNSTSATTLAFKLVSSNLSKVLSISERED